MVRNVQRNQKSTRSSPPHYIVMREQRAAPKEYTYIYEYNTRLLCSYYEFSLGHWPWSPHAGRSLYLTHIYIYILLITYNAIVGTILYYYYYAYEYNNTLVYTSTQCDGVGFYFPISPHAYTNTHKHTYTQTHTRKRVFVPTFAGDNVCGMRFRFSRFSSVYHFDYYFTIVYT